MLICGSRIYVTRRYWFGVDTCCFGVVELCLLAAENLFCVLLLGGTCV